MEPDLHLLTITDSGRTRVPWRSVSGVVGPGPSLGPEGARGGEQSVTTMRDRAGHRPRARHAATRPGLRSTSRRAAPIDSGVALQFRYLDGLRGIGALVVVIYHAALFTGLRGAATSDLGVVRSLVRVGDIVVPMFTVISGYVLMLQVLRSPDLRVYRGFWYFIRRRARRILPPYYAALAFFIVLITAVPVLRAPSGTQWDSKLPLSFGTVASHLFMLHDLDADWIGTIDGPMWSIAVEWQLYLLMPLVFLPIWRRFGGLALLAVLLPLTVLPAYSPRAFGDRRADFLGAHPWLAALFVAGMLAAELTVAKVDARTVRRNGWAAATAAVLLLPAIAALPNVGPTRFLGPEVLGGLVAAVVLVWLGRAVLTGRQPLLARLLQRRTALALGLISYSLYLFHSPLLGLANLLTLPLGLSTGRQWALMTFGAAPVAIVLSTGFFLLVERRFVNARQKRNVRELALRTPSDRADLVVQRTRSSRPSGGTGLPVGVAVDALLERHPGPVRNR